MTLFAVVDARGKIASLHDTPAAAYRVNAAPWNPVREVNDIARVGDYAIMANLQPGYVPDTGPNGSCSICRGDHGPEVIHPCE